MSLETMLTTYCIEEGAQNVSSDVEDIQESAAYWFKFRSPFGVRNHSSIYFD